MISLSLARGCTLDGRFVRNDSRFSRTTEFSIFRNDSRETFSREMLRFVSKGFLQSEVLGGVCVLEGGSGGRSVW